MRFLRKAFEIARVHGAIGLASRGAGRVKQYFNERDNNRRQRAAWSSLISQSKLGPVFFPQHETPLISIVIPVFNRVAYTAICLNSLLRELDSIATEVIVVDDASTDGTAAYLELCTGIRVIRHITNQGFVQSVNDGAAAARAHYLYFLNNDTLVTPNWLAPLLRLFQSDPRVGAVGSQLRDAEGRISEAGALIFRDGNGWNYLRGKPPSVPGGAFTRDVDYCSAASLMVRTDLFRELGGFAPEFAPGYYEDADLCFRLRAAGYRVIYQPNSVVIHLEGGSAGTDLVRGMKQYQMRNRETFLRKWRAELQHHVPPEPRFVERGARRLCGTQTVLVIDSFVPFDDRSAGGRRTLAIMQLLRELGWHVIFVADDGGAYEPYTSRARRAGIEVIPHHGNAKAVIRNLQVPVDLAWVCRPDLMQKYVPLLRRCTTAKIVYDTIDLHHLRLHREESVTGHEVNWRSMQAVEVALARSADWTVVTGEPEQRILRDLNIESGIVPIVEPTVRSRAGFSVRRDLLFLGNYTHAPNADAAAWLANTIMPLVWERIPNVKLILAGADPTPAVTRLANERIAVTGHVLDILPLFEQARVFVAPLRFGAGMKGKIVQSLAHGLPVVTTTIGEEGIGLIDGASALIANDALNFALAIIRLYNDEALWKGLSAQAQRVAKRFSPEIVKTDVENALCAALYGSALRDQTRMDTAYVREPSDRM